LEGAISRPESASRTLMETALAWLVDEHLVQVEAQGKKKQLRLQDNGQDAPLQEFIDRVAPFL
jgi:hypothetical protein